LQDFIGNDLILILHAVCCAGTIVARSRIEMDFFHPMNKPAPGITPPLATSKRDAETQDLVAITSTLPHVPRG
jgi:hypothetical protein